MKKVARLADRIVEAVNRAAGDGVIAVADLARTINERSDLVRAAAENLHADGAIVLLRRGKGGGFYIAPKGYPVPVCRMCHREFKRKKPSKRVTCSRSCASAFKWSNPETRAKICAGLKAAASTPKAKARTREVNRKRWSDPKERERLSERNRKVWADSITKAELSSKIRVRASKPEFRKKMSEIRKRDWASPEYRERMLDMQNRSHKTQAYREKMRIIAIERNKNPEFRARLAERNRKRAQDPENRKKISDRMKAYHARRRAEKVSAP